MKKIILAFMILFSSVYTMPLTGKRVEVSEPVEGSLVSASERLVVNEQVEKSIVSASRFLEVNKSSKNIVAASRDITVSGDVENILVSASKTLFINGNVGDSIVAACEFFNLTGNSGDVVVAAKEVDINGEIDNLFAAAESVYISGTVKGDVYASTDRVELVGDGKILGNIYYPEEKPKVHGRELAKKGFIFIRIISLVHSLLGILILSALLKKSSPRMAEKLSENLFKKGIVSFFIGLIFMIIAPIFIFVTIPIFGMYSFGLMLGYFFIMILSKVFLVLAASARYNYLTSIVVVVALSFFYPISFLFSIIGLGLFVIFIKDLLIKNPELRP